MADEKVRYRVTKISTAVFEVPLEYYNFGTDEEASKFYGDKEFRHERVKSVEIDMIRVGGYDIDEGNDYEEIIKLDILE